LFGRLPRLATPDTRQPVADRAGYYRDRKQAYQTLYEAAISTVASAREARSAR
jgi:hypothetical protein